MAQIYFVFVSPLATALQAAILANLNTQPEGQSLGLSVSCKSLELEYSFTEPEVHSHKA